MENEQSGASVSLRSKVEIDIPLLSFSQQSFSAENLSFDIQLSVVNVLLDIVEKKVQFLVEFPQFDLMD